MRSEPANDVGHQESPDPMRKTIDGQHLIGAFAGNSAGPTLIVVGGLHGNERADVEALQRVAMRLEGLDQGLNGRVYLLAGNTRALSARVRYIDADLNRTWTPVNLSKAATTQSSAPAENTELAELQAILDHILVTAQDEVYVLDLHSTSAGGRPFATIGDTLRNRSFALKFPVTIVLGIEEQLDGTMLEFLNGLGAVTFGFEGGQHSAAGTVDNHEALTMLALENTGILPAKAAQSHYFRTLLESNAGGREIYEVRYRHPVTPDDEFEMRSGFRNFDPIRRHEIIATDRDGPIEPPEAGSVLMPLYQKQGEDGYFLVRRVRAFWLWLSGLLRQLRVAEVLPLLPGVKRQEGDSYTLEVNTRVARWFPLQIFHLLGFRKRRWHSDQLIVSRRRHDSKSPFVG